jgi:hypothetical protein
MTSQDKTCEICYEQDVERVLPCKHRLCSKCFVCVNKCPYCRRPNINMKSVLAPLLEDYDGLYDKEIDNDMRDDYTLPFYIFHFRNRDRIIKEGYIKLPKIYTPHFALYGYTEYENGLRREVDDD